MPGRGPAVHGRPYAREFPAERPPGTGGPRPPFRDGRPDLARTTVTHVLVLGGGSWGTALAAHLGRKGTRVTLWAYEAEVVAGINGKRWNPLFLPDIEIPASVT